MRSDSGSRRDNVMFMMPDDDWHSVLDISVNGLFCRSSSFTGRSSRGIIL